MKLPNAAVRLLTVTIWCGFTPFLASAQQTSTGSSLGGVIITTDGLGIELADIEILPGIGRRQSSTAGKFRFDSIPPGRYLLAVRRIGFIPLRTFVTLEPGQHLEYEIVLEIMPVVLPDVVVEALDKEWTKSLRDFEFRRQRSVGTFLDRDQILESGATELRFLVRRHAPTFYTASSTGTRTGTVALGNFRSRRVFGSRTAGCNPRIAFNGQLWSRDMSLDDLNLAEVEALEIFKQDEIPLEFRDPFNPACGLVVVWGR